MVPGAAPALAKAGVGGKNTMIRKALANGHEEHPEAQASVVPYGWSKGENIQRFPKGNGLYNGDIYNII